MVLLIVTFVLGSDPMVTELKVVSKGCSGDTKRPSVFLWERGDCIQAVCQVAGNLEFSILFWEKNTQLCSLSGDNGIVSE